MDGVSNASSELVLDSGAPIENSSNPVEGESGEEGIYLTYDQLREYAENYQYVDSGTGLTADQAVIALYKEYHFTLYGLFPLIIAVVIFVAACIWFERTFCR